MTQDIASVLEALLQRDQQEARELFEGLAAVPAVQRAAQALQQLRPQDFSLALNYPVERLQEGLLAALLPEADHQVRFVFLNYEFVHRHLRRLFERHEGSACCADKAGTVVRAWLEHCLHGRPIAFDLTQEVTYYLPRKVLNTEESIQAFFQALERLYSGDGAAYVQFLTRLQGEGLSAQG